MREAPFTLEDLPYFSSPRIGLAVLGHPISHSISPILHNAALAFLAESDSVYKNWSYERLDVKPQDLPEALNLLANRGFYGVNLTIPHKVDVLKELEKLDSNATTMGAVNTLKLCNNNWHGYNTDGFGLEKAIENELGCKFQDAQVLILGAGGAARAAAVQALLSGARKVHVHNRSSHSLGQLLEILHREFDSSLATGSTADDLNEQEFISQDWIVINATSLGLKKQDPSPLFLKPSAFGEHAVFYDMIYNPKQTLFLSEAEKAGFKNANGLSMLVYQAAKALEIWTGKDISSETMFQAARKHFGHL